MSVDIAPPSFLPQCLCSLTSATSGPASASMFIRSPQRRSQTPHNEKCLHISSVSQTPSENKKPLSDLRIIHRVNWRGKINALCISTALLKQDKKHASRSEAAAIE